MFHLYGLMIGIAVGVGHSVAEKIEPEVNKIAPWVIVLGIVGARVWHVIETWSYYGQNLSDIVRVWNGGLSIWGGIIGGILAWWIVDPPCREAGRRSWRSLGAIATVLPLSQAIGRVGNGINGEFTNLVWILPWWGAEALLDLMLFVLLRGFSSKYKIWVYLVGYGLIRLVLQPYRL
jgi:prolipoprotein diacylglyceryltransferase